MPSNVSSQLADDWVTCDMVAQYAYCPRRFHLMYVQGRWEDNEFTVEGRALHSRVDRIDQLLPEAAQSSTPDGDASDAPPEIARSVSLGCDQLQLMGKLDLVSCDPEGGEAAPVETKRGKVPDIPEQSYPPERAQLMAQGLLLRSHGYQADHGFVYYAGSRKRVRVEFSEELETDTLRIIERARSGRGERNCPDPLQDSPKCWGCSLAGICLPDETRALASSEKKDKSSGGKDPRRLYAARDQRTPLYVQEQGARIGKRDRRLIVTKGKEILGEAKLRDVSQVVIFGNTSVTPQALHLILSDGKPVVHLSTGGWFYGLSVGMGVENAYARKDQFEAATDEGRRFEFALGLIEAKIGNQRAILRRNGDKSVAGTSIDRLGKIRKRPPKKHDLDQLRGWEGNAAAEYFSVFSTMLKVETAEFHFQTRNRRPPKDPVNALLSFTYALLAKECTVALMGEGLDPWWGLYHQPRHGRPALALDLMEPFRPVIADSVVLSVINTRMVTRSDFIFNGNACAMKPKARKAVLQAWESRLDQLFTHPTFEYRCSWRTILRIQARLFCRWLQGDIKDWTCPVVR